MKSFVAFVFFVCLAPWSIAQSFEGRLTYREQVGATERTVTVFVAPDKALVQRGTEKALYYLVSAQSDRFMAWQTGSFKADEGSFSKANKSLKVEVDSETTQIIAGWKARQLKYVLADGSVFEGWYTVDMPFNHNAFMHRLLGDEWGRLPGNGLLLRWQLTDGKNRVLVAGELQAYETGKQDPKLFEVPALSDR